MLPAPEAAPLSAPPEPRWRRWARAFWKFVALSVVFVAAALAALLLHVDLPAPRRAAAQLASHALDDLLEGRLEIGSLTHFSLARLEARDVRVFDPDGALVAVIDRVQGRYRGVTLLREIFGDTGPLSIRIDHVRLDGVRTFVFWNEHGLPTLVDAFAVEEKPEEPPGRPVNVELPIIEVGELLAQGELGEIPIEAELKSARGSLSVTLEEMKLDFARFGLRTTGPEGWETSGLSSLHLRTPGPFWAHFDGQLGELPLHVYTRFDDDHLEVRADLPKVDPRAARSVIPGWPFKDEIALRGRARGVLPELQIEIESFLGGGKLSAQGQVIVNDEISADLDFEAEHIDLAKLDPSWPKSDLSSKGTLLLWSDFSDLDAELNGTIAPGRIGELLLPAIDFLITSNASGVEINATPREQGVSSKLRARISREGEVRLEARVQPTFLERSPRLQAWLGVRGMVTAELDGRLEDGELEAKLDLRAVELGFGEMLLGRVHVTASARGPVSDLAQLSYVGRLSSENAQLASLRLARLTLESQGTPQKLALKLSARHSDGAELRGQAQIEPSPGIVREVRASILRNGEETSIALRRGALAPNRVELEGLRIESGGRLEADVLWSPARSTLNAHGRDLDLGRLAEALGVSKNSLDGVLSLDGQLSLGASSSGRLEVRLKDVSFATLHGVDLEGEASFEGRKSRGHLKGHAQDLGQFTARWDGALANHPTRLQSWLEATGQAQLAVMKVPLATLHQRFDLPSITRVGGEGFAQFSLARTESGRLPQALFVAGTERLSLSIARKDEPPLSVEGLDVSLAGAVEGGAGKLALTGRVFDQRGDFVTLSTELDTALSTVLTTLSRGESLWPVLADRPLRAVAIVPARSLRALPTFLRPDGYDGRGAARAVVSGTLKAPDIHLSASAEQISGEHSPFMVPVDGELTLRYAVKTGKLQGSLRVDRHNVPVARGTFDLEMPWQSRAGHPANLPWSGRAQLVFDGMPLELIDVLAERQIQGSVQGSLVVSQGHQSLPRVQADLNLQRLKVGGVTMGEGRLVADSRDENLFVRAHFEDELGSLTASAQAEVARGTGALPLPGTGPLRLTVEARNYDAKVLYPFVQDVLSDLGGQLQGTLGARLEPPRTGSPTGGGWQAHLEGRLRLVGGVVEPSALGLRLLDTQLDLEVRRDGVYNVVSVEGLRARANSDRPNLEASGKIYLRNLDIEHARFEISQRKVPFSVGGARMADLTGDAQGVIERKNDELVVDIDIPRMTAELPQQIDRPLIELDESPDIRVLQPLGPAQMEEEPTGPITPWQLRFQLGDQVRVQSRQLNLRLRGAPVLHLDDKPRMSGFIDLVAGGRVNAMGRSFVIEQGSITFDTDQPSDPHLDIVAAWRAPNGVRVMAHLQGTARSPQLSWSSDPALPGGEPEVIALVLGSSTGETTDGTSGANIAGALANELLGQVVPARVELSVSRETAAGEGQVASLSQRSWDAVTASYQLSDQIWVEGSYLRPYDTLGAFGDQESGFAGAIDWRFHRDWSLRTDAGNLGTGIDLLWRYRY